MKKQNSNADLVWRYARACYLQAEEKEETEWKKTYFEKGLAEARRCVELDPKNGLGHKWVGILLGRTGDFIPTKEKIANAFIIKDCFVKALEQMPSDPTLYHCLGQWCYTVANISWLEKKAASLLFGTPPESSYEEAEKNFLRAAQLNPSFMDSAYALGEVYTAMKKKEDAKLWFTKCQSIPAPSNKELRMQAEAKKRSAL
eukprot:GGOE01000683.1.p1 GENE.GGOE01000683.1~~GGOE01000683.1.p1  ORF type:complete len:235 (+),score=69.05 GGOE01000683.1:103-705(+)